MTSRRHSVRKESRKDRQSRTKPSPWTPRQLTLIRQPSRARNFTCYPPKGAVMADFSDLGKVTVDLTQSVDEEASTSNAGGQATDPQDATGGGRAGTTISDAQLAAEVNIYKSLDDMCRDLNILEAGYFKCVDETRGVIKEVSTHLDTLENAYVASVMAALAKWQEFGAEALQAMHTASPQEWDMQHTRLIKANVAFCNACMEANMAQAKGLSDHNKEVLSWPAKTRPWPSWSLPRSKLARSLTRLSRRTLMQ